MKIAALVLGLGILAWSGLARAQDCVPKCRTGYSCAAGKCVPACNPPCAANELCSPQGQCVSACNPGCASGEVCTPQGQCVSACNPPCAAGEACNASGQCVAQAAAAPTAAPPAPAPAPAPAAAQPAPPPAAGAPAQRAGFLQAGALIGRYDYSGEQDDGDSVEGSGMTYGVEAAGGLQMSPKLRVGAGLQFFSMPDPEGSVGDGPTETAETGKGGVVGAYLAWGGDGGLLIDGILGYGGSGTEDAFGGWGPGLFPGVGYQSAGPFRFSIVGRLYVLSTSAESGESGTFTGFQAIASIGSF